MVLKYRVGRHEDGWAYQFDGTWSERFETHQDAMRAARNAAERHRVKGKEAVISYETVDGEWHTEVVQGSERPEAVEVGTIH